MTTVKSTRPTMRTISQMTGVSQATVSIVLSGQPASRSRVSETTKAAVLAAAQQIGYTPNHAAKALRSGRSNIIQIALNALNDPWSWSLVESIQRQAQQNGLYTSVLSSDDWFKSLQLYESDVAFIDAVYDDSKTRADLQALVRNGRRLIIMSDTLLDPQEIGADVVRSNPIPGCELAMAHLLSLTDSIGCLTHESALKPPSGVSRYTVYRDAMMEAGLTKATSPAAADRELAPLVETFDANTQDAAFTAAIRLLSSPQRPRAVYATTDFAGRAAISAAQVLGLNVPGDVLVTGAGNSPGATAISPTLTTVGPDGFFQGVSQLIVDRALHPAPPVLHEFEWRLHKGDSTDISLNAEQNNHHLPPKESNAKRK